MSARSLILGQSAGWPGMSSTSDEGCVTPGGVKTITRLVSTSHLAPGGAGGRALVLIEVQIWPPGVHRPPSPPSGGRGAEILVTRTQLMCRLDCYIKFWQALCYEWIISRPYLTFPGLMQSKQGFHHPHQDDHSLISPHSWWGGLAIHLSSIVASSQVCCPLIDGIEGTTFLTASHLCWEILLSLMYPLCYFHSSRKCQKITFKYNFQDIFTKQQHLV